MKRIAGALFLSLLMVMPALAASKRIVFEPGRFNTIVKGKTTGGPSESEGMNPATYVLRARAGQVMIIGVTSPRHNVRFSIYAPGAKLMEDAVNRREYVGELPASGDYEIMVYPRDRRDSTFELGVEVNPPRKQSLDAELIAMLAKEGENMTKPRKLEFNLMFETKANATRAADKIKREGFETRVEQVNRSETWWVFAQRTMVPREDELSKLRQRLRIIAAQEEGDYETWGIVK